MGCKQCRQYVLFLWECVCCFSAWCLSTSCKPGMWNCILGGSVAGGFGYGYYWQRWCDSSARAGHLATYVSHRVFRSWHCPEAVSSCPPRVPPGKSLELTRAEISLEGSKEMMGLRLLQDTVKRPEDPLKLKEIVFTPSRVLNLISPKPKMQTLSPSILFGVFVTKQSFLYMLGLSEIWMKSQL